MPLAKRRGVTNYASTPKTEPPFGLKKKGKQRTGTPPYQNTKNDNHQYELDDSRAQFWGPIGKTNQASTTRKRKQARQTKSPSLHALILISSPHPSTLPLPSLLTVIYY